MSKIPQTIRPYRRRGPRLGLCLVVFLASGAAVYYLGQGKPESPRHYTARATVAYELPRVSPGAGESVPLPKLAEVRRQILSEENLQQVLSRAGASLRGTARENQVVGQLREQIRIAAEGEAQRPAIAIDFTGRDPAQVRGVVNQLAEQYAAAERTRLGAAASRNYRETHRAAEQARRELQRVTVQLEACLKQQADARQPTLAAPALPKVQPAELPRPMMVDNPAWLALDRQRAALEERRTQLLLDRTPAHPEVKYVEAQLGELRDAQARVPRQVPDPSGRMAESPSADRPPVGTLGQVVPSGSPAEDPQAVQTLAVLRAAVDRSRQRVERLAQAERQAGEWQQTIPQIQVHRANRCQVVGGAVGLSPQWLVIAGSVGLALAMIAGYLSARLRRDRPVASVDEVQMLVPAPIVGVIAMRASGRIGAVRVG